MAFQAIVDSLGRPAKPTRLPERSTIPSGLSDAIAGGFVGLYGEGLFSIWGDRECISSLGGWETYLPSDSVVFASTAFGVCAIWGDDRIWITDPQYGQIIESEMEIDECLEILARDKWLKTERFTTWRVSAKTPLGRDEILVTVPLLPLGGSWDSPLHPEPFEIFLGMTAGPFDPKGSMPADVRRLS